MTTPELEHLESTVDDAGQSPAETSEPAGTATGAVAKGGRLHPAALLALQRSAGNAVVARLVADQRQVGEEEARPQPGEHQPGEEPEGRGGAGGKGGGGSDGEGAAGSGNEDGATGAKPPAEEVAGAAPHATGEQPPDRPEQKREPADPSRHDRADGETESAKGAPDAGVERQAPPESAAPPSAPPGPDGRGAVAAAAAATAQGAAPPGPPTGHGAEGKKAGPPIAERLTRGTGAGPDGGDHTKGHAAQHGKGGHRAHGGQGAGHRPGGADKTGGRPTGLAAGARPPAKPLPTPQPIPRQPIGQVAFAEPDVEKLLPEPAPGEPQESRRGQADALRAELAADRRQATEMVGAFVDGRRSQATELAALKPSFEAEMAQVHAAATAAVDNAVETRSNLLRSTVERVTDALHGEAKTAHAQIDAEHESAVTAMRTATLAAKTALHAASETTSAQVESAEAAQLTTLGNLYTQVQGEFRSAAEAAGALAVTKAGERAAAFRAGKIGHDDSFLDGPLTDNRCEAQADAAEKVGAGYRDELRKEGDKQADKLGQQRPTDESAVRTLTGETRSGIATALQHALDGIDEIERQSLANAQHAADQLHGHVDSTVQTLTAGLAEHEAAQLEQLHTRAEEQKTALQTAAAEAATAVGTALTTATTDLDGALDHLVTQLSQGELPDPKTLEQTLAQGGAQLDQRMAQLKDGVQTQGKQAVGSVAAAGTQATAALTQIGDAAVEAAQTTGTSGSTTLATILGEGVRGLQQLAKGHEQAAEQSRQGFTTASQSLLAGQTAGYGRINENLSQGGKANVDNVSKGLTDVVVQDMPGVIASEAQKARDQVKPRWKSVLKWVLIIAIVLVVAIVLGPMVIGAAAGLATALGTSAVVGTIVGGALVGAATSAVVTVVDNAFEGRALTTGLGRAIALGAIGGGLGGAAAGLLSGPMQGMTLAARYGTQVAVDMTIDTGINAATGNLSWENFGTSMAMSMLVNGVSVHPRVQVVSETNVSKGFGTGYDAGTGIRTRMTGTGAPGSLGAVGIDATHVNLGDSAGAGSPYAGKWNMQGGGHNAGEFRGRIAGEGGPPADYRMGTVAEDPVTGVAIDEVTRNQLQNAPGGPRPVLDPATGAPQTRTQAKSLFPPGMDRADIHAAGQRALELSLGGAPGSEHTAPPGPGQNGQFSAIVTTPDGHPIRVRGYYSQDPVTGQRTIQTVYPDTDLPGRQIEPVPGSRTNVPGAATPPLYDSGD